MAEYTKLFLLGSGTYGQAWVVHRKNNHNRKQVLKEVSLANLNTKDIDKAVTEAEVLAGCKHKNVIKYVEAFVTKEPFSMCIVMEYAAFGDLHKCITQRSGLFFPYERIHLWLRQMMAALDYIHTKGILHRDVKPQNLFLSDQDTLKLGDFGIARILKKETDKASTFIGTPFYLSPEIFNQQPYSFKSDMWSAGCVVYELCCLHVPFTGSSLVSLAAKVERGLFPPLPSHCDQSLHFLVKRLLDPDPQERLSAKNVLELLTVRDGVSPRDQTRRCESDDQAHDATVRGRNKARQNFASKVDSTMYTVVKHPKVRKLSMASPELSTMLHRQRTQSAERSRSASAATPKVSPIQKKKAPCFNILRSHPAYYESACENSGKPGNAWETEQTSGSDSDSVVRHAVDTVYELHRSSADGLRAGDVLHSLENVLGEEETEWLVRAVSEKESLEKIRHASASHYSVLPLVLLYVQLVDDV